MDLLPTTPMAPAATKKILKVDVAKDYHVVQTKPVVHCVNWLAWVPSDNACWAAVLNNPKTTTASKTPTKTTTSASATIAPCEIAPLLLAKGHVVLEWKVIPLRSNRTACQWIKNCTFNEYGARSQSQAVGRARCRVRVAASCNMSVPCAASANAETPTYIFSSVELGVDTEYRHDASPSGGWLNGDTCSRFSRW